MGFRAHRQVKAGEDEEVGHRQHAKVEKAMALWSPALIFCSTTMDCKPKWLPVKQPLLLKLRMIESAVMSHDCMHECVLMPDECFLYS